MHGGLYLDDPYALYQRQSQRCGTECAFSLCSEARESNAKCIEVNMPPVTERLYRRPINLPNFY